MAAWLSFTADVSELLRLGELIEDIPKTSKPAVTAALNDFAQEQAKKAAEIIAGYTGMDVADVLEQIDVTLATPDNMTIQVDASAMADVLYVGNRLSREWVGRDDSTFQQNTLVRIVTQGDGRDCDICNEAAENSPYTMAEIANMQAKFAAFQAMYPDWTPGPGDRSNLIHPNCRCAIQSWKAARKDMVWKAQTAMGSQGPPSQLFDVELIGPKVAAQIKLTLSEAVRGKKP